MVENLITYFKQLPNLSHFGFKELIVIFVALLLFLFILPKLQKPIAKKRPSTSRFGFELIYTDQKTDERIDGVTYSELLVSEKFQLKGKPDYVFQKFNAKDLMPIELKSGTIGDELLPHNGDLMQLVVYFLILEDVYGVRPKSGRLIYKDYMFVIKNTRSLRRKLKLTLAQMRDMLKTGEQDASPSFAKCKFCLCRGTVCEYN